MHQIEVDDDVMTYLKSKAEAFVDNPNSVLRRELLGQRTPTPTQAAPVKRRPSVLYSDAPNFPLMISGTPQALRQILNVVYLVGKGTYTRPEATAVVAKALQVTPQTVLDKYCRQLGLTAFQFDQLLDEQQFTTLRTLLKKKFPEQHAVIDRIITSMIA